MRMKICLLAVLGCLVALAGCGTTQSIPIEDRERTFDAPHDQVLQAVADCFIEDGYGIANMDSQMGFIATDYKQGSGLTGLLIGDTRTKFSAQVRSAGEGQARVTLTLVMERKRSGEDWRGRNVSRSDAAKLYQKYFDAIAAKL